MRRVFGKDAFFTHVAGVRIEVAFVTKSEAALLAAVRANIGGGDGIFFAIECRRDGVVKLKIFVRDLEIRGAQGAGFFHNVIIAKTYKNWKFDYCLDKCF